MSDKDLDRLPASGPTPTPPTVRCMQTEDRGDRTYQCDSYSGHPGEHSFNIDLTYWTGIRPHVVAPPLPPSSSALTPPITASPPVGGATREPTCECSHRLRNHADGGPCMAYLSDPSSDCKCRQFRSPVEAGAPGSAVQGHEQHEERTENGQKQEPELKGESPMCDAIDAAAKWWATVIERPKFDALGGQRDHNMELAQVMMTVGNRQAPPVDTERFRAALATRLRVAPEAERRFVSVDYGPCEVLDQAAHDAGVADTFFMFPVKTCMWIEPDKVTVRYGYGAPLQTIWPEPA